MSNCVPAAPPDDLIHLCYCSLCGNKGGLCFFIPTTLKWLPRMCGPKYLKKHETDSGIVQLARILHNNCRIYHLLELSLPPLLAQKFHTVDVRKLMSDDENHHFMEVATWFVLWNEANGLPLLNKIHVFHNQLNEFNKNDAVCNQKYEGLPIEKDVKEWQMSIDRLLYLIGKSTNLGCYAPKSQDNATKASEFLLEPCIIIQLPWNTVLLHQWLVAALVEVLMFEKISLELRHWPLPPEIEPTARELLFLVKQLKERIILGFFILTTQVMAFPKVDTNHPNWILDEVVLPSIATLKFLVDGKASTMVNSIKKISWSNSEFNKKCDKIHVSSEAFTMNSSLYGWFAFQFYNPVSWGSLPCNAPFHNLFLDDITIPELIKTINSTEIVAQNNKGKKSYKGSTKIEETYLYVVGEDQKCPEVKGLHLTNKERTDLVFKTVKELVIDAGMLPQETWSNMNTELNRNIIQSQAGNELFEDDLPKNCFHMAVISTLLYWELYRKLILSELEESALARINILGLEIVHQEQLIKLTNICSNIMNVTPVVPNLASTPPMSVGSMSQVLEEVHEGQKGHNRTWLWAQFPEEWRKPVSLQEPVFAYDIKFPQLIEKCQNRIGRIVLNAAKKCFDVYNNGGEVFPNWQIVQYMLPCYVAMFHEYANSKDGDFTRKITARFLDFLHGILKFYEESYQIWHTKITCRQIANPNSLKYDKSSDCAARELYAEVRYYKELTNLLLQTHVGTKPPVCQEIHRFQPINKTMMKWPFSIIRYNEFFYCHTSLKAWLMKARQIYLDWYKIFLQSWDFPIPGSVHQKITTISVNPKKLADAFKVDAIMQCLENVANKASFYAVMDSKAETVLNNLSTAIDALYEIRFHLYYTIADHTFHVDPQDSIPPTFEKLRILLNDSYKVLREFKELIGPSNPLQYMDLLPSNPPELKIAVNLYLNCKFNELENMLLFFTAGRSKKSAKKVPALVPTTSKKKKKVEKKPSTSDVDSTTSFNKCRNCPKTERKWGPFKACEKCVEEKYPDINFFCSKECKEKWWKEEHMAEHLEFELGLSNFSNLKIS